MNPLLHSPGMLIHPPMLYTGLVGLAIPFAIVVSALINKRTGADWIRLVRRWVLVPWIALGVGLVLGGAWAYTELGWGGYWGWDPVENAAFMPWLAATAFLHSAMVQERRGMLKIWNVFLVTLAATLATFGAFLTRSGCCRRCTRSPSHRSESGSSCSSHCNRPRARPTRLAAAASSNRGPPRIPRLQRGAFL